MDTLELVPFGILFEKEIPKGVEFELNAIDGDTGCVVHGVGISDDDEPSRQDE